MKHTRRHRPAAAIVAACLATSLTLSGCQVPLSTVQKGADIVKRVLQAPSGGFVLAGNIVSALRGGDPKAALVDTLKLVKELRLTDALGKSQAVTPSATGDFQIPVTPAAAPTAGGAKGGPIVAPKKYTLTQATEKKGSPVKLQVVLTNGKVIDLKFDSGNKALSEYIDAQLNGAYDLGEVTLDTNGLTAGAQNNPLSEIDSDGDGQKDNVDTDDDGDKAGDAQDQGTYAYDTQENHDNDKDGVGDVLDTDDDNDGKPDSVDRDDDGDGSDDEKDADDDGDGLDDTTADIAVEDNDHDFDDDGWADEADWDDDGDGTGDAADTDQDGDGTLDEADSDDDGDGIPDSKEAADADFDGVADYFDPNDADASAWEIGEDFDWDALYAMEDWDFDFVDDESDTDISSDWYGWDDDDADGDGIPDSVVDEGKDSDGDGVPDEWDTDDDNSGALEVGFDDAAWTEDEDGDGVYDWDDLDENGDGALDPEDENDGVQTNASGGAKVKWTFEDQNCNGSPDATEKPVPPTAECKAQMPEGLDADGDGWVSKEEMDAAGDDGDADEDADADADEEDVDDDALPGDDEEAGDL